MDGNLDVSTHQVNRKSEINSPKTALPDENWPIIEAAKFYAKLGWPVFPVDPADKTPLIKAWQAMASTDAGQIDSWWSKNPAAMIGMVCGPRSGVAVVDLDVSKSEGPSGIDQFIELEKVHGDVGVVPSVYSASGGQHLYFDANSLPFRKHAKQMAENVDLRSATPDGEGTGYIVVPPSRRTDGALYIWEDTKLEQLGALPVAPDWLARRLCFKPDELDAIEADAQLASLLSEKPRSAWRGTFDAHRQFERAQERADREQGFRVNGKALDLEHPYIAKSVESTLDQLRGVRDAQNDKLHAAAVNLGRLMSGAGMAGPSDLGTDHPDIGRLIDRLMAAAQAFPVLDRSRPWSDRNGLVQARKTIDGGLKWGLEHPRDLSHLHSKSEKSAEKPPTKITTLSTTAADLQEKSVEWLWPGHIPIGGTTVVLGQTKVGKSQFGIWLLARVSKGDAFPKPKGIGRDETSQRTQPARAVLITGEDDIERVVVPRLKVAKADLSRIEFVSGYLEEHSDGKRTEQRFSLEKSVEALTDILDRKPDIKLIVIDPLNAYIGGKTDTSKNNQMRAVLQPLSALAEKRGVAVVLVHHMKKGQANGSVTDMSGGSNAIVETARSVLAMALIPNGDGRAVLQLDRSSYAENGHKYAYRIESGRTPMGNPASWFHLLEDETPEMGVLEATNGQVEPSGQSDIEDAQDFLRGVLAGTSEVLVDEIKAAAKRDELPWHTVKRAKARLLVKHRRVGNGPNHKVYWSLPAEKLSDEEQAAPADGPLHSEQVPPKRG